MKNRKFCAAKRNADAHLWWQKFHCGTKSISLIYTAIIRIERVYVGQKGTITAA